MISYALIRQEYNYVVYSYISLINQDVVDVESQTVETCQARPSRLLESR